MTRVILPARWREVVEAGGAAALFAVYLVLRGADTPRGALEIWYVAATAFAVAFPYGGLLLVIPVGMFIGPYFLRPGMPAWTVWIVAWCAGVLARVLYALVRDRAAVIRTYRNTPMLAAIALLAASALSLVTTWRHFGRAIGTDATYRWLWGPATFLLVLLAAVWVLRDGRIQAAVLAVAVAVVGSVVSLVLWFAPTWLRAGPLEWTLGPPTDVERLHGITYLAPGLEALMIVPAALMVMAAIHARDARVRLVAAAGLVPAALAAWLTYNRAALLGGYVIVVVAAWHARPRLGRLMAALGLVAGVLALPVYLGFRGSSLGAQATVVTGQLLAPSDQLRITAWGAALRMWEDAPLLGHGFWSFFRLHTQYGSPVLDAPHNDWLRLFAEGGVVAGVAGLAFVAAMTWHLWRGHGWLPRAVLAGFISWVLALCFNNILSYDQVSIPLAVILATGFAQVRLERDERTEMHSLAEAQPAAEPLPAGTA